MYRTYSRKLFYAAKQLRAEMTHSEKQLWQMIRRKQIRGVKFRKQVPFDRFVLDFMCSDPKIIIEVDGQIHGQQQMRDQGRDEFFRDKGYTILRFRNEQIRNDLTSVLREIDRVVERLIRTPIPTFPLNRGKE